MNWIRLCQGVSNRKRCYQRRLFGSATVMNSAHACALAGVFIRTTHTQPSILKTNVNEITVRKVNNLIRPVQHSTSSLQHQISFDQQ